MQDSFEHAAIGWIAANGLIAWRHEPRPGIIAHQFTCDSALGQLRVTTVSEVEDCLLSLAIRLPARIPARRAAEAAALAATRSTKLRLGAYEYDSEARAIQWRGSVLVPPDRVGPGEVDFLYQVGLACAAELMPELTLLLRGPELLPEIWAEAKPRAMRAH
jgi:hypothetical protein